MKLEEGRSEGSPTQDSVESFVQRCYEDMRVDAQEEIQDGGRGNKIEVLRQLEQRGDECDSTSEFSSAPYLRKAGAGRHRPGARRRRQPEGDESTGTLWTAFR